MNGRDRVILTNGKNCEIDGKIPVCFYLWMSLPVCVCCIKNKNIKDKNNIPEGNYKVYSLG